MRVSPVLISLLVLSACPPTEPDPQKKDAGTTPVEKGACEGPRPTPLRLLTRVEYNNTVRDILGDESHPANALPREVVALNFENNADIREASTDAVARYLDVAETVATAAVRDRRARLVTCASVEPGVPTPQSAEALAAQRCGLQFIQGFGRRLYRRPLETDEVSSLVRLFNEALARDGFNTALEWTLTAMLQTPQFLYRMELGAPIDPKKASIPLTNWDLASKLSYFIWATAPDDELLNAAGNGALTTEAGLKQQATRMLADARSVDGMAYALNQLLRTSEVGGLEKAQAVYPEWNAELASAAQTSLALFVDDVIRNEGTYKALLTSNKLYVNSKMTKYVASAHTTEFTPVMMLPTERVGLLTQPGLLARLAGPDQSSPIRRGIFVLDKIMCQPPSPPPPGLVVIPPALDPMLTTRERFTEHSKSESCFGCHKVIDPLGYAFEHYDGMGVRRETDNNKPVDATGTIVTANDTTLVGPFTTELQLATRLANSRQVHDCMASNLMRYALGRADQEEDACSLKAAQDSFFEGSRFKDLQLAIVMSSSFRTRALPETP